MAEVTRNTSMGFLIGFGAGVAIGLLAAPKSGAETRRYLSESAKSKADGVKQRASGLWDSAHNAIESGQEHLGRVQDGLKNAVRAGSEAFRESTSAR